MPDLIAPLSSYSGLLQTSATSYADTRPRANLLGVGIDAVNLEGALATISRHLADNRKGYVCAIGVHGILESLRDETLAATFADSCLNVPDGTPTVWIGRWQGFRNMDHVTGPALMRAIFSQREFSSRSHFLYGGKPGIVEELAAAVHRNYPWARIVGTYTPPFRDLTCVEQDQLIRQINSVRPDFLWVGISTPRQELWMRRMLPQLDTCLMFGVGAAFDFLTGHIRECPGWIKRAGFHWLHRLLQDPRRLWRRNVGNTAFLWHIARQCSGIGSYPLRIAGHESAETALLPSDLADLSTQSKRGPQYQ